MNRIIELPEFTDSRGGLTVAESINNVPFDIQRAYWVYDVPENEERGGHSHKVSKEFIIALKGSFCVTLDNGKESKTFVLDKPNRGLLVNPDTWHSLDKFSTDAVCLVFSSEKYDKSDYINTYSEFKEYIDNKSRKD